MPILDIFRFIAASLVLLAHYKYVFGIEVIWEGFAPSALSWFFVVSGFILSYRYPQLHRAELKKFYLFRLIRIYPIYLFAVLISSLFIIIGYSLFEQTFFTMLGRTVMSTYDLPTEISSGLWIEAIVKHLLLIQLWSDTETLKFLLNPPLWSLANEMFFYLCFPLLLLFTSKLTRVSYIIMALVLVYGLQYLLIQAFVPNTNHVDWFNINTPVYTNPLIRIVEFIIGMILYQAYRQSKTSNNWFASYPLLVFVIALYVGILYINLSMPIQYTMFWLSLPVITLMVYILTQVNWQPEGKLRRISILSGGASYVMYALHWPFMELCHFLGFKPDDSMLFVHITCIYILMVVLSFAIHIWVEKPLRVFILYNIKTREKSQSN
jgi:peptidoglycan/LPS O-acetylase OafA/YrhL